MFCPKCRTEYRKGFNTCADCEISLVNKLPPEPSSKSVKHRAKQGWKCPECGLKNNIDNSNCVCGYDSNRPFKIDSHLGKGLANRKIINYRDESGIDLTKQERKFAEISAKKYHRFLYRKKNVIASVGLVIFLLGLWRILPLPMWFHHLLTSIGFIMFLWYMLAHAMTVTGKLYKKVQKLESKSENSST